MNPIYITTNDHARLSLLVRAANGPVALQLRGELDRAIILDPAAVPSDVVTMGSRVQIEDLASGDIETYTLTYPEQANVDELKLSILAPIGTAIIGCSQGQEVSWPTPGGARQIRIVGVEHPAPAAPTGAFRLPVLQSTVS